MTATTFESPIAPRTLLRSSRSFRNTRFRRFATIDFSTPHSSFAMLLELRNQSFIILGNSSSYFSFSDVPGRLPAVQNRNFASNFHENSGTFSEIFKNFRDRWLPYILYHPISIGDGRHLPLDIDLGARGSGSRRPGSRSTHRFSIFFGRTGL